MEFRATSREMTDTSRSIPAAIRLNAHPAFSPSAISTRSAAVNLRRVPATSNLPRPSPLTRALLGRYDTAPRMNTVLVLATVAVVLVVIFDYTNGFHDASNIIATTIASRAMTGLRLSA